MTTACVLIRNGRVWLASDQQMNGSYGLKTRIDSKWVFGRRGTVAICGGAAAMMVWIEILNKHVDLQDPWSVWLDFTKRAKELDWVTDTSTDKCGLPVYDIHVLYVEANEPHRVWFMDGAGSYEAIKDFAAIGSGRDWAYGAYDMAQYHEGKSQWQSPTRLLADIISVACDRDNASSGLWMSEYPRP